GNVRAAKENLRFLDGQPDFNRIWSGGDAPEHAMAAQVIEQMRAVRPVACIDVHNTSGTNPHHACVNLLHPAHLALASRFGHFVVYADKPSTVATRAFGTFCPAVIIECGMPD
ncbi:MAG: peptidase M14, partial [Xanthomonadales bacterium]|nr:peptidase M14 [Xanthomonadales bacterium]